MIHETAFQHINVYFIRDQNRVSELLWPYIFQGLCKTDVDFFSKYKQLLDYINLRSSPREVALKHMTSPPST